MNLFPSRRRVAWQSFQETLRTWRWMPHVRINLQLSETEGNAPFFARMVKDFHANTLKRWRKFPCFRQLRHGVALCMLPCRFDDYFMEIEASARRNYKKAIRNGYQFARLDYNAHLEDVAEIWRSAETRQGAMPRFYLEQGPRPHRNPPSRTSIHDYPYFGVFKDGRLVAYAGALVSGDIFMIEQIFGHAGHQANGVVPMLVIAMGQSIYSDYPRVKFYAYGTYFGAGESMRRFKRKLLFYPHRVSWELGNERYRQPVSQLVYRMRRDTPLDVADRSDARFIWAPRFQCLLAHFPSLQQSKGWVYASKLLAKSTTAHRSAYCILSDGEIVGLGEVTFGRCRHYRINEKAVVIGPVWTAPSVRGRGFGTWGLKRAVNELMERQHHEIYIDTSDSNVAMRTVIERCQFGEPIASFPRYAEP